MLFSALLKYYTKQVDTYFLLNMGQSGLIL